MVINDNMLIVDFQNAFNEKFPGLRIEFYKKKHDINAGSLKADQYENNVLLSQIATKGHLGDIEVQPSMTVAELEQQFEDNFGLHVQVFRRSNTLWLQTSSTDDWTLETQNTKGLHSMVS
ncbi:MAG: hypothetical protein HKN09_02885 [Saprospiraceae bacterium]|nr:hypothetical protein [Saprospiraceae bacterium]